MRHISTERVISNRTRTHFCHFHHIGHTFSYRIAETYKSNVTSLQIERRGALCQSTEKTSERGKMVVGRVAILGDESLIGPQSGGTFTDIPTPRLRKDSLLKNGGATICTKCRKSDFFQSFLSSGKAPFFRCQNFDISTLPLHSPTLHFACSWAVSCSSFE